ncbi:MAG: hypothetical protein HYW24_01225 [Candidatus Aenigmarchaeota archaeon]|nr:hypothetical protein [Candidatus Aenigmarchaeota archaeon]
MEMEFSEGKIIFNRELSDLDKFVIEFVGMLNSAKIKYVIISGYISILFGRSRATEDIDVFIGTVQKEKFDEFMKIIEERGMWALNSTENTELFSMLQDGLGIRIAKKEKAIPNFELKFPKKDTDFFSLNNPLKVVVNGNELLTSPLEMQIAYKLYLGSEKDLEDATHIYEMFKDKLDVELLNSLIEKLNVGDRAVKYVIG